MQRKKKIIGFVMAAFATLAAAGLVYAETAPNYGYEPTEAGKGGKGDKTNTNPLGVGF